MRLVLMLFGLSSSIEPGKALAIISISQMMHDVKLCLQTDRCGLIKDCMCVNSLRNLLAGIR